MSSGGGQGGFCDCGFGLGGRHGGFGPGGGGFGFSDGGLGLGGGDGGVVFGGGYGGVEIGGVRLWGCGRNCVDLGGDGGCYGGWGWDHGYNCGGGWGRGCNWAWGWVCSLFVFGVLSKWWNERWQVGGGVGSDGLGLGGGRDGGGFKSVDGWGRAGGIGFGDGLGETGRDIFRLSGFKLSGFEFGGNSGFGDRRSGLDGGSGNSGYGDGRGGSGDYDRFCLDSLVQRHDERRGIFVRHDSFVRLGFTHGPGRGSFLIPGLLIGMLAGAGVEVKEDKPGQEQEGDGNDDTESVADDGADDDVVVGAALVVEVVQEGVELGEIAGGVETVADHNGEQNSVSPGEQGALHLDDGVEGAVLEGAGPAGTAHVPCGAGIS